MIKKILRGLIDEREPELKEIYVTKYFDDDKIIKTFLLFDRHNFSVNGNYSGLRNVEVIKEFLDKLEFEIPITVKIDRSDTNPLIDYIHKNSLLNFLHIIEIYSNTMLKIILDRQVTFEHFDSFLDDLNNFYDKNSVPYKLHFDKNNMKAMILKKDNEVEEINKSKIFDLLKGIQYEQVNEYFINALKNYTQSDFKDSIENSYLALEKLLKISIENHKKDANNSFKDFQTKYNKNFKGIFLVRKEEIKKKIAFVETIRSEIKAHSPKEQFNTNEFLEETAKYQLNEVMNLIELLFNIMKNG